LADEHRLHVRHEPLGGLEEWRLKFGAGHQDQPLDAGDTSLGGADGEDRFVVGPDRLQLLRAPEAGAKSGGQEDEGS
jgi:hypothetical protein